MFMELAEKAVPAQTQTMKMFVEVSEAMARSTKAGAEGGAAPAAKGGAGAGGAKAGGKAGKAGASLNPPKPLEGVSPQLLASRMAQLPCCKC